MTTFDQSQCTIAVFCAARPGTTDYRELARSLGETMAAHQATLIYGAGSKGLMGAVCEGVVAGGGQAIGVLPTFMDVAGWTSPHSTRTVITPSMHARKEWMETNADAFVVLPGGLGTLDELITVMTTKQLQQHAKPIVLLDPDDYFGPLMHLFQHMIDHGFIPVATTQMPTRVTTPEEALSYITATLAHEPGPLPGLSEE
jgi:uncharacterized protein (TIGR00730 family)